MSAIELLLRLATGGIVTQSDALRLLHSAHGRSDAQRLERVERLRARDAALLEAARILGADLPGAWTVAGRLEDAVERFETRLWPRLRAGMPVGELSPCDTALYRAFLTGERIPRTQRRLYDLVT